MKQKPPSDTTTDEAPAPQAAETTPSRTEPEDWEAFLEDEGDCCGGCNHKPR